MDNTKLTSLQILEEKVCWCTQCDEISAYRKENGYKTVLGDGNIESKLMFIGEGPGLDEALQGKPFVGKAGKLLTDILAEFSLTRDEVYICNIVKCRPPNNRTPFPGEIKNCSPYLENQLEIIDPKWIVCLGKTATNAVLNLHYTTPIGVSRNKLHMINGRIVLSTYHPAYVLRNPIAKTEVIKDLALLFKEMAS